MYMPDDTAYSRHLITTGPFRTDTWRTCLYTRIPQMDRQWIYGFAGLLIRGFIGYSQLTAAIGTRTKQARFQ